MSESEKERERECVCVDGCDRSEDASAVSIYRMGRPSAASPIEATALSAAGAGADFAASPAILERDGCQAKTT
jgi:hypothetical protein